MMNNKGITLITVVVIIIVIIIIATTSIITGNRLIVNSRKVTDSQIVESIREAVARRKAELSMQGTITPKGESLPGTIDPLIGDGTYMAKGWYALDKTDLADLGVKDVESRFLVNYELNEAINMGDSEYVEKFFVATYMHKVAEQFKGRAISGDYYTEALHNKTSEGDTANKMFKDTTELNADLFGTNWYLVEPTIIRTKLTDDFPGVPLDELVRNTYLINFENSKYVKKTAKFKEV